MDFEKLVGKQIASKAHLSIAGQQQTHASPISQNEPDLMETAIAIMRRECLKVLALDMALVFDIFITRTMQEKFKTHAYTRFHRMGTQIKLH